MREVRSKSHRHGDKFEGGPKPADKESSNPILPTDWHIPTDIVQLQEKDPILLSWFEKVTERDGVKQGQSSTLEEASYILKGGILYQRKGKMEALAMP